MELQLLSVKYNGYGVVVDIYVMNGYSHSGTME